MAVFSEDMVRTLIRLPFNNATNVVIVHGIFNLACLEATNLMWHDHKGCLTSVLGLCELCKKVLGLVVTSIDFQSLPIVSRTLTYPAALIFRSWENMWGDMTCSSLITTLKTITVDGNFMCIILDSSEGSALNHPSFQMPKFWFWKKFFTSEIKTKAYAMFLK